MHARFGGQVRRDRRNRFDTGASRHKRRSRPPCSGFLH
jgi:hypothetical protein